MKPSVAGKQVVQSAFEALEDELVKPIVDEAVSEVSGFLGYDKKLSSRPKAIAKEDLERARNQQKLKKMGEEDDQTSEEKALHIHELFATVSAEYNRHQIKVETQDQKMQGELVELKEEVAKLAKAAGVETKAHLETTPKKVGLLDIKMLTHIIRFLRLKVEESKSAQELVDQRQNAKRATGMLAWVSGKQMKIHEQGTLTLQG